MSESFTKYDKSTDPLYTQVTVEDIVAAMERNGYTKGQKEFIRYNDDNSIKNACALGQAALNLGLLPESLYDELNELDDSNMGDEIASINDSLANPELKAIAIWMREMNSQYLQEKLWVKKWTPPPIVSPDPILDTASE